MMEGGLRVAESESKKALLQPLEFVGTNLKDTSLDGWTLKAHK